MLRVAKRVGVRAGTDPAERAADRWRGWVERHPVLARRARRAWVLWAWCSLVGVALTAVLVPDTRRGMAVYLWMQYALLQFWLLARTKTITWRGLSLAFSAGVLAAPFIGVVDTLVSHALGWRTSDVEALVWVAGPVEEALKLLPLVALALVARNRWRRFSVSDFILLGAAAGAGFQFVEDSIRRITAGRPSLLDALLGSVGQTQHGILALWPGWSDSPGGGRFPSHFATTALVAAGLGLALHLRRRLGRWIFLLPSALFAVVIVDHSLYNASVTRGDVAPGWLEGVWSAWGSGREARPLLLLLLVVAVVVDHRTLRTAEADLPPLPGMPPAARLEAWAARTSEALRLRAFPDAAEILRRAAAMAGAALSATASAVVACGHELGVTLAAARRSSHAWLGTLGFLRERRGLGFAVEAGPAGRRHVNRASAPLEDQRRALALLLGGIAVVVAMAGLTHVSTGTGEPAFLANLFDELGRWWNSLPWWQQALVVVGFSALLTFGGMGFLPALSLVSSASSVAAYGQGIATFIRDPRQATRDYVRNLTPAEIAAQLAGLALNRILPGATGAVVGKRIRARVLSGVEQAAVNRSRGALSRALDGAGQVNGPRGGGRLKAAASDGERTLSGWKRPRPAGFAEASPEEVRDLSGQIGHELERSGGLDQVQRGGFPGKHQASHAEKQLAFRRPDDPIAVSEPMCNDCTGFFRRLATHRNRPQVVTDPRSTWIFRPDGTFELLAKGEP